MKLNANQVIQYIEGQGKVFPHAALKRDTCILAGGSVANAIISIWKQKKYPINDFDVFVYKSSVDYVNFHNAESVATVTEDDYPSQMTSRLHIVGREQFEDTDFISIVLTDDYKNMREKNDKLFYETVLNSFDLNCVQAGIYWDHERLEYVLLTTPEFNQYLLHDTIHVVNVHSNVTFLRMLKKADDLDSYISPVEELDVISVSCNPENLASLTEEQAVKHSKYVSRLPQIKNTVLWGINRIAPDDRETPVENPSGLQIIYDAFSELGRLNKRPLKIKITRAYLFGTREQKINILRFLEVMPYTFAEMIIGVPDLLSWIAEKEYTKEQLRYYRDFYIQNKPLHFLLKTETFSHSLRRISILKEYGQIIMNSLWLIDDIEDRVYSDDELVNIILLAKIKDAERQKERERNYDKGFKTNFDLEVEEALEEMRAITEKHNLDYLIEQTCRDINAAVGYNMMTKDLFKMFVGTKQ